MTVPEDALFDLLPAVHRQRDEAQGYPLKQYLRVLTDELAVVTDGVEQLYDDLFVETAAPWVLPYLAELIGLRGLPSGSGTGITPRAEVANTIGYRRRKGTAAVLEQIARDVTGWPARAVEFFELLAATQHVNHVRTRNLAVAPVRDAGRLEHVGSPFERLGNRPDLVHTVDVRRIPRRRGRYNVPNVGVFVWRLRAYPLTATPAVPVEDGDLTRFHCHPLGVPVPLFASPLTEDEITHLAEPVNVPHPLGRRELAGELATYYGPALSIDVVGVPVSAVDVCDLSDVTDATGTVVGWAHTPRPAGRAAVDPVLGRLAFGDDQAGAPLVSVHFGATADLGGGEYARAQTFAGIVGAGDPVLVSQQDPEVTVATIDGGVARLAGNGTVEVADSGRYVGVSDLVVDSTSIEFRAADGRRPTVVLTDELVLDGDGDGEVTLNGLLVTGGLIRVRGLRLLRLSHCTLVPGIALGADGASAQPGVPSLVVESAGTTVEVDRCVLGPLRVHADASATLRDSIVDAGRDGLAYAAESGDDAGGALRLDACTVLGKVHARTAPLVSNSIVLGEVAGTDDPATWPGPFVVHRTQGGCVRFSYLPPRSRSPRRHRCQPAEDSDAARVRPVLVSTRYPDPAYCQLDRRTAEEIWRGSDDESEMGAFHHLYQPQRAAYLEARLADYLRLGLEAGIFFAS